VVGKGFAEDGLEPIPPTGGIIAAGSVEDFVAAGVASEPCGPVSAAEVWPDRGAPRELPEGAALFGFD
jgi:hypothetical protein